MRPLLVVAIEVVEAGLRLHEVLRGRLGGFLLQCQVDSLVAAVLGGMAGLDALDVDPKPQPPDGKLAQIEEGIGGGKGDAVIGADGFGFEMVDGRQQKIQQLGIVQIDDDVEIGANTTVDRARFGRTWIQQGVKIDNLVQIAHNVVIGKNTVIAAQTGIAGSVRIGQRVLIGGQVGIIGHIEIGDNTAIGAQSGISKNISGGAWWASPAVPLAEAKEQIAWVRRLGKLIARVKEIEKKLGL